MHIQNVDMLNEKKFENSDKSVWDEDLTLVYKTLEHLKKDGVTNLRKYLLQNPKVVEVMAASVKVVDVNNATLKLFGATTKKSFFTRIDRYFTSGATEVFIEELCAIWEKKSSFSSRVKFLTFDEREIDTIISFNIPNTLDGFANVSINIHDSNIESYIFDDTFLKFLYVSKATCKNLGYELQELKKITPLEIAPDISPKEFFEKLSPLNTTSNNKAYFSTFHQRNDGTTYPVEFYVQVTIYENRHAYIATFINSVKQS